MNHCIHAHIQSKRLIAGYKVSRSRRYMSSRALKKLERSQIKELHDAKLEVGPSSENEAEDEVTVRKSFNAFNFLDNDSEEEEEKGESTIRKDIDDEPTKLPQSQKSKKSQKKKSKKKKGKNGEKKEDSDEELEKYLEEVKKRDMAAKSSPSDVSKQGGVIFQDMEDYEDEYNSILEPATDYDSNFKFFTTERLKQSLPLLSIDSRKDLDPDEEFKIFLGDLSTETLEDANSTTSLSISPEVLAQFRKLAKLTRGWGGRDRRSVPGTSRKLLLTRIKDDFPPTAQKPLSMEELSREDILKYLIYKEDSVESYDLEMKIDKEARIGVRYFTFNKILTVQERVACTKFYASVVLTPDPESLMQLVQHHPYHAETLLQVAMILLRQGNEKATSNALVERCLFVFDRVFHKNFHELLMSGNCGLIRLPFESFMNRQFYLCLFRYIINLGERSTFFTALSYCKFLLGVNPAEDPMGVRYFIDFYAIMSERYDYLIKFVKSPLVATFEKWFTPGLAFSSVLAYLHQGDEEGALSILKRAYETHPYLSYRLVEKYGDVSTLNVKESDILHTTEQSITAETYLVRVNLLWKQTKHVNFLVDHLVNLFNSSPPQKRTESNFKTSIYNLLGYNNNVVSSEIPYNLIRFVILSGENKIMAKLPEEIWAREDLLEYDVLPPSNDLVDYDEHTGFNTKQSSVVDHLLSYVDQNLLGNIIQTRTGLEGDFELPE